MAARFLCSPPSPHSLLVLFSALLLLSSLCLAPAPTAAATVGFHDLSPVCLVEYLTNEHAVVRGYIRHNAELQAPELLTAIEAFLDSTKHEDLNKGRVSTTKDDAEAIVQLSQRGSHFKIPEAFLFVVTIAPRPGAGIGENRIAVEQQRQVLSYANYLAEEKAQLAKVEMTAKEAARRLKTFHKNQDAKKNSKDEAKLDLEGQEDKMVARLQRHLKTKFDKGVPFHFDIPKNLENGEYMICVRLANPNFLLTTSSFKMAGASANNNNNTNANMPIHLDLNRNVFFDIIVEDQLQAGTEPQRLREAARKQEQQSHQNDKDDGGDNLRMNVDGLQVFRFRDADGQFKEILQTPEYLQSLMSSLTKLHGRMLELTSAGDTLQVQEKAMRSTTESTFTRVWMCGAFLVAVTGAVVWFEFHFLKRTIKKRKLI